MYCGVKFMNELCENCQHWERERGGRENLGYCAEHRYLTYATEHCDGDKFVKRVREVERW